MFRQLSADPVPRVANNASRRALPTMVLRFRDPDDRERHDLKVERRVMVTLIVLLLVCGGAAIALEVRPDVMQILLP